MISNDPFYFNEPIMNKKQNPLQNSILILCSLQDLLDQYKKFLLKEKGNSKSILYETITGQIIITSCSYLEEWENLGNLSTKEIRIKELRNIVKPAINRIYKWKDLKIFHDAILAHNQRTKSKNNRPALNNLEKYLNCPKTLHDYQLLLGCISVTKNALLRVFSDENNDIPYHNSIEKTEGIQEFKDENEYSNQFKIIIDRVQNNLNNLQHNL